MSKTYTGIELLKAIENQEIKEGTEFIDKYDNKYVYELDGLEEELVLYKKDGSIPDYSLFIDNVFTVVEDDKIDIQSIKEMNHPNLWKAEDADIRSIVKNVNELVRAVKQLDRQINNKDKH